jgi:hypothetical protein
MDSGEQKLWQAVLENAIDDALRARSLPDLLHKRLRWFQENNRDFHFVCRLAGSDPEIIRKLLMTLLEKGDSNDIKTFTKSIKNLVTSKKGKNRKRKRKKETAI